MKKADMTRKILTGAIAPSASEKGLTARAEEARRTCWAGANAVAHPTKVRIVAATFILDMMWLNERIVRRKANVQCVLLQMRFQMQSFFNSIVLRPRSSKQTNSTHDTCDQPKQQQERTRQQQNQKTSSKNMYSRVE